MTSKRILAVVRWLVTSLLFVGAAWLIVLPYLKGIFNIQPTQLFGAVVGLLGVLVIDLHRTNAQQQPRDIMHAVHTTIADGIGRGLAQTRHLKRLRVLGSTTEVILPAVREAGLKIDRCDVLIQDFDIPSADPAKDAILRGKVETAVATWADLVSQKVIGELDLRKLTFQPSHYMVVFDEGAALLGLYYPASLRAHAVDFIDPIYIDHSTSVGRIAIDKLIKQFDEIFVPLPCLRHEGGSQGVPSVKEPASVVQSH